MPNLVERRGFLAGLIGTSVIARPAHSSDDETLGDSWAGCGHCKVPLDGTYLYPGYRVYLCGPGGERMPVLLAASTKIIVSPEHRERFDEFVMTEENCAEWARKEDYAQSKEWLEMERIERAHEAAKRRLTAKR